MRQHISSEQLNLFLDLQIKDGIANMNFERLSKLNKALGIDSKRNYPPSHLFTVGKMIEILTNSEFGFPRIGLSEARYKPELIVVTVTSLNSSKYHGKSFEGYELVDALWESIKEVI